MMTVNMTHETTDWSILYYYVFMHFPVYEYSLLHTPSHFGNDLR